MLDEPPEDLPLHRAAATGVYGPDLDALIASQPEALTLEDEQGMLPLHHACGHGHVATALALLAAEPRAVRTRAVGGILPLHLACGQASDCTELVTQLLSAGPEAAASPDRRGCLPLHLAASSGAPLSVMRALLAADRRSAAAQDAAGQTAAHCAAALPTHPEALALLLDVNPQVRVLPRSMTMSCLGAARWTQCYRVWAVGTRTVGGRDVPCDPLQATLSHVARGVHTNREN
jgi:hypothetical protein